METVKINLSLGIVSTELETIEGKELVSRIGNDGRVKMTNIKDFKDLSKIIKLARLGTTVDSVMPTSFANIVEDQNEIPLNLFLYDSILNNPFMIKRKDGIYIDSKKNEHNNTLGNSLLSYPNLIETKELINSFNVTIDYLEANTSLDSNGKLKQPLFKTIHERIDYMKEIIEILSSLEEGTRSNVILTNIGKGYIIKTDGEESEIKDEEQTVLEIEPEVFIDSVLSEKEGYSEEIIETAKSYLEIIKDRIAKGLTVEGIVIPKMNEVGGIINFSIEFDKETV